MKLVVESSMSFRSFFWDPHSAPNLFPMHLYVHHFILVCRVCLYFFFLVVIYLFIYFCILVDIHLQFGHYLSTLQEIEWSLVGMYSWLRFVQISFHGFVLFRFPCLYFIIQEYWQYKNCSKIRVYLKKLNNGGWILQWWSYLKDMGYQWESNRNK